jgi:hypothetical protein
VIAQMSEVKNAQTPSPDRRSVHRTQWAAQFAVASELCKRGHQVAFTMGNHPKVDLMVISPSGAKFAIDVKGLYRKNFWVISRKEGLQDLFYILAFVPDDEPNQFFILSQDEVNTEVARQIARTKAERLKKGLSIEKSEQFPGLPWSVAEKSKDQWGKLPS